MRAIEECFRAEQVHHSVTIPYDERLATMLDGSCSLDALTRPTRPAIKRLGLALVEQLV